MLNVSIRTLASVILSILIGACANTSAGKDHYSNPC